jgi:hypothetical protein
MTASRRAVRGVSRRSRDAARLWDFYSEWSNLSLGATGAALFGGSATMASRAFRAARAGRRSRLEAHHVALAGSVCEAVRRARANAPHTLRVVVEVDTMAQLDEALEAGAEGILLDNFQTRDMVDAVKRVRDRRPQTVIEASGGITLDRVREVSKTGVDVISVGALTHSVRAINYSCEIHPVEATPGRESAGG